MSERAQTGRRAQLGAAAAEQRGALGPLFERVAPQPQSTIDDLIDVSVFPIWRGDFSPERLAELERQGLVAVDSEHRVHLTAAGQRVIEAGKIE